jgi:hypothetical protein
MATKILRITGTVLEAGNICHGPFVTRGVRLDIKEEPVELLGLNVHEVRGLGMLLGKKVTITVTTEETMPGVES